MDALNLDYIMGFILGFGAGFIVCAVIGIFHRGDYGEKYTIGIEPGHDLIKKLLLSAMLIVIPVFSVSAHQEPYFGIKCIILLCLLFPSFLYEFCGWHLVHDFRKLNRMGIKYRRQQRFKAKWGIGEFGFLFKVDI